MTKFAKSAAPILAALALCFVAPGRIAAQTAAPQPPAQKPMPKPAPKPAPAVGPATPAKPSTTSSAKPATAKPVTPKPVAKPLMVKPAGPAKPVVPAAAAKPTQKPAPKPAEAKAVVAPAATPAEPAPADATDTLVAKRDPFVSPLATRGVAGGGPVLPPGKAGLVVATVRIDGTVKSGDGMIAMVSNPEKHVYFVREGDRLYDGDVETINLDGVTFRENSKDAFGKPVERMVTKRIYQSAGESQ